MTIRGIDANGYELRTYRVVWYFRVGRMGDCEGRTWAKELVSEAPFQTREKAELHRAHHPDIFQDKWGQWRTKASYGMCGIFCENVEVDYVAPTVEEGDFATLERAMFTPIDRFTCPSSGYGPSAGLQRSLTGNLVRYEDYQDRVMKAYMEGVKNAE